MERRLYDHQHASSAMGHLVNQGGRGFRRNVRWLAAHLRKPIGPVRETLLAIDVLDGLFAPLLGYDGKPRNAIRNRRVPNRKARS
jgi:hypothetical protein